MANDIPLSELSPLDRIIAKQCMKNPNAKSLTGEEISLFLKKKENFTRIIGDSFVHTEEPDALYVYNQEKSYRETMAAPISEKQTAINKISDQIREAVKTHRGVNIKNVDVPYWAEKIYNVSSKYNVPAPLLISIIEKESNGTFTKNVNSRFGAGPMQATTIAVQDYFPQGGGWHNIYKMMDEDLLNDILYTDSAHKKLRAGNAASLRAMAGKDDELGIKMGLLTFEMNYVKAVAAKLYGKADIKTVEKTIKGLKSGTIKLNEKEAQACVTKALQTYNSVFKSYAPEVVDSLKTMGVKFIQFNDIL